MGLARAGETWVPYRPGAQLLGNGWLVGVSVCAVGARVSVELAVVVSGRTCRELQTGGGGWRGLFYVQVAHNPPRVSWVVTQFGPASGVGGRADGGVEGWGVGVGGAELIGWDDAPSRLPHGLILSAQRLHSG